MPIYHLYLYGRVDKRQRIHHDSPRWWMRCRLSTLQINGIFIISIPLIDGGPKEQHATFRKLITARKHNEAGKNKGFIIGLERLYQVVGDPSNNDYERLIALSTLGRVASSIRGMRDKVNARLKVLLVEPIPAPQLLEDVDDRAYIGKICAMALPPWTTSYAASATVVEETGEQARQAFLQALLKAAPDLETAIVALIGHLQDFKPDTEEPGNSMIIKLRRIFEALRSAIAETMPEPGDNSGKSLAMLIKASFVGMELLTKNEAILATSEEVAGVVHEMVRLRFSMATEAATYQALLQIKELVPVYVWKQFAEKSNFLAMVATDIIEALLILGRQGVTDASLADRLAIALGSQERSKARLADLAKKPGLSSKIKFWLVEGRSEVVKTMGLKIGESQQLSDDIQLYCGPYSFVNFS